MLLLVTIILQAKKTCINLSLLKTIISIVQSAGLLEKFSGLKMEDINFFSFPQKTTTNISNSRVRIDLGHF